MAAAAITEIAEELQCTICFDELDRPKVLGCKHVFCCKCLIKWVEQKKLLECPVCKNTGSLRRGEKIEDLPEPLILTKLQETLTRFMTASLAVTGDRTCDLCARGKAAGYFCHNCGKNMCEQCEKKHSGKKPFKNHKVIQLSKHTVCSEHKGELKTLYCQDCELTICSMCLDDKHESHNVTDATDVVPAKAKEFQIFKKAAKKIRKEIVQHESAVKTRERNLLAKYRSAERELKEVRRKFIELMDEAERELEQKLQAEKKKMLFHMRDVEDAKVAQDNLLKYIEDLLSKGSDIDIVSAAADIPSMNSNVSLVLPKLETPSVRGDELIEQCKSLVHYGSLEAAEMSVVVGETHTGIYEISGKDLTVPLLELRSTERRPGTKLWESKIDCVSQDTLYDEKTGDVWICTGRKAKGLWKYDVNGKLVSKMLKGTAVYYFTLDTQRDTFIAVVDDSFIASISKSGDVIKKASIPGVGKLKGVAYLPDRDWYAVCDNVKNCVWFVDALSLKVVKQIGSQGSGDDQFSHPMYVCYQSGSGYPSPVIVVADSGNDYVKVLDTQGLCKRKYGSHGSEDRKVNQPCGVCIDNKGRIFLCDSGNRRVVRFYHSGEREQWEVVVTPDQLGGFYPRGICITNRGLLAVTSITVDMDNVLTPPSHLSLFTYE